MLSMAVATDPASKISGLVNGPARVRTLSRYCLEGIASAMKRGPAVKEQIRFTILTAQMPERLRSRPYGDFQLVLAGLEQFEGLTIRNRRCRCRPASEVETLGSTVGKVGTLCFQYTHPTVAPCSLISCSVPALIDKLRRGPLPCPPVPPKR